MEHLTIILAENFVAAVIGTCVLVGMGLRAATTIATNTFRERSRREIAAYVAEGSITPEQGERLIKADIGAKVC
jgi:hypothetical protein